MNTHRCHPLLRLKAQRGLRKVVTHYVPRDTVGDTGRIGHKNRLLLVTRLGNEHILK